MRLSRVLVCVALLAGAVSPALAQAPAGTVSASEQQNYGRILFTLPTAQRVTARIANGVLVVSFSEPVNLSVERIARELPTYVSVARVDPDQRGVRLALTRTYRVNQLDAGEKVFVDLIPENWQGLLPGLPPDVVAELARRARVAEAQARTIQRQREQMQPRDIEVRSASLPTLQRLVFTLPATVEVEHQIADGALDVTINAPFRLDPARLRPLLPAGVRLERSETVGGVLRLKLAIPERWGPASFREDDSLVVDFVDRERPQQAETPVRPAEPSRPPPVAAAPAATAPAPAANAAPSRGAAAGRERPAPNTPAPARPASPLPNVVELPAAPPEPVEAAPEKPRAPQPIKVTTAALGDGARIDFQFPRKAAAAGFLDRGQVVLVFETEDTLDPQEVMRAAGQHVSEATVTREGRATVVRLQPRREGLIRLAGEGLRWTVTTGERGVQAARTLTVRRGADIEGQTAITSALPQLTGVHWITLADGEPAAVATAHGPVSALPRPHRFVEFVMEQSLHGVVVRPIADDVSVRAGIDEVTISRASGLAVSIPRDTPQAGQARKEIEPIADKTRWAEMRMGDTLKRVEQLKRTAALAPRSGRGQARLDLATFLSANELHAEVIGVTSVLVADEPNLRHDRRPPMLRAIAQVSMGRTRDAEATLALPALKDDPEAELWRAVNDAKAGRHARALGAFRTSGAMVEEYPDHLQATVRREMVRSAIAKRDVAVAEREIAQLEPLAPGFIHRDEVALMRAQLDEINGRPEAAMSGYRALFDSPIRPVAAWAQLKGVQLADRELDEAMPLDERIARLETTTFMWRGDDVEIEAMGELGLIYAKQGRWREAFSMARAANLAFPEHPITRKLHDDAARHFAELFTSGKGDSLSRVDALALFYDFKEFLPIGQRGDEIIRRLADRLVEVDLLAQGAELLQHQIDNRLTGAARATIAARLAMIRLMDRKPAEALRAIGSTRLVELPADVKRARLLLEAKALSDLSRTDLALELLEPEHGPEVDRLRADVLWTARRWRDAGEAHERILGDSWRSGEALSEAQRADVMRAAVAYVMSDEALSLDRLRSKFAAQMAQTPDARTFAFVTGGPRSSAADLRELARNVASADTLMDFMEQYRKRYPDYASSLRARRTEQPATGAADAPPAGPSAAPEGQRGADRAAAPGGRPG